MRLSESEGECLMNEGIRNQGTLHSKKKEIRQSSHQVTSMSDVLE